MCSVRRLMVFNVCVKFHENVSSGFKVMERTRKIVNTKRAITPKVGKSELRFMCSARHLMVFNVCVKFHENMSSGFKVMERTRKLLTDTHILTEKRRKHYTPMAYFVCRGYNQGSVTCEETTYDICHDKYMTWKIQCTRYQTLNFKHIKH